ncbi:MAG: PA2778 family cysteine peptidase [Gammaproteobacteria bacterium]|nr:PA2778 family cysteine peptidase [Gammaproteobacteria bacterium]
MRATWLLLTALLAGCATQPPTLPRLLPDARLRAAVEHTGTPFFAQDAYQCGPAALATVLVHSGIDVTPDELVDQVYLPARKGSLQAEIAAAARRHGRIPYPIAPSLAALAEELHGGRPVLVLQNLGLDALPVWHYAVVIGIDPDSDTVILRSGTTRRERLAVARFVNSWRRGDSWGIVLLRPGELPADAAAARYLQAVSGAERALDASALLAAYRAARTRWPNDLAARFGLARSLDLSGDPARAAAEYRAILRRRPDHPLVLNNLALSEARRGCTTRARQAVDRALATIPRDHALRATIEETRAEVAGGAAVATAAGGCD